MERGMVDKKEDDAKKKESSIKDTKTNQKFETRTLTKGMYMDAHSSQQPEDTYPFALNYINKDSKQIQFGSNEHANKKILNLPAEIAGKVHQDAYNRTIFVLRDSSIHILDHNKDELVFVGRDSEFGCEWEIDDCEALDVIVYVKNGDTYIQWSSSWTYYVVNITELLSPKRKSGLIEEITNGNCKSCNKDCNYFKAFKPKCPPKIKAEPYQYGGSLTSGAYFFSVRQMNADGSRTAWSLPTLKACFIHSEFNKIGDPGKGRIEIEIEDLNCAYEKIEIAIIHESQAGTTVFSYGPIYFTGSTYTFTYVSNAHTVPISLQEILLTDITNYQGKFQTIYNNRMYYYGTRPYKEYNVQHIANQIGVVFYAEKYSLETMEKHQITSLPRGEALSFGIWLNEDDGNQTYAGIIPCVPAGGTSPGGDLSDTENNTDVDINSSFTDSASSDIGGIRLNFSSLNAGSKNLIKNPGFEEDTDWLFNNNGKIVSVKSNTGTFSVVLPEENSKVYQSNIELKKNTSYKLSAYGSVGSSDTKGNLYLKSTQNFELDVQFNDTLYTKKEIQFQTDDIHYIFEVGSYKISGSSTLHVDDFELIEILNSSTSSSGGGSSSGSGGSGSSGGGGIEDENFSFDREPERKRERDRGKRIDSVQEPDNNDKLLYDVERLLVESYQTEVKDLIDVIEPAINPNQEAAPLNFGTIIPEEDLPKDENNTFAESLKNEKDSQIADKDLKTAEEIGVKWGSLLSDLLSDGSKKDVVKLFRPNTIKELTSQIIEAVVKREDIYITSATYTVNKNTGYSDNSQSAPVLPEEAITEELDIQIVKPSYPEGTFVGYYSPECSIEEDSKYPCTVDCDGNPVFGALAGTPVRNPKVPDESIIPYYESYSTGVRSSATPDADEYADGYGIVVGVEFRNIRIDYDEYFRVTGRNLCRNNPYTIGMVKLSDHNKTILTKGVTLGGFISSNAGKNYIYQNLACNSFEKCDKHIDLGDKTRMDPGAAPAESCFLYGLDQQVLQPYIAGAETLTHYRRLGGIGFRHNLYAEGTIPQNRFYGRRIDITGTVQSINLNRQARGRIQNRVGGLKYVKADSVSAPPGGGGILPLMNMYNQECLWIANSGSYTLRDKSFVGDVLDHEAPISSASGYYSVLSRELRNQYGPVENRSYIPKLTGKAPLIRGLIGNRFISPYSFVKTSWVSDKVGDKFKIENMVPGKEDRCICDAPDDAINNSKYHWTQMPKSGDASDAKNWCGLHTVGGASGTLSRKWIDANGADITESDMYYPGTLTTLITVWGEWETNPYGIEVSDKLKEQRRDTLLPIYELGSQIDGKRDWSNGYLDNFHIKRKQPSMAERTMKILIDSIIPILVSLFKLEDLVGSDGALDLTGNIASLPIYVGLIAIFSKVLFTQDFIDEFLGLPLCKQESEGGVDFNVEEFFMNYGFYSSIFSREMDLVARPQMLTIKGCNNSDLIENINRIAVSDIQQETSIVNGYTVVRPMSYITLSGDKGRITDLFVLGGKFYAHTTDAIYLLHEPKQDRTADILSAIHGVPDTLYPILIIGSNPEGMAGLQHKRHSLISQVGKVFVDYDGETVYIFTGSDLKPIALSGVYTWLKSNLKYCSTGDCINGYGDHYFTIGYDPVLQRVLITKGDSDNSWTLSYDPYKEQWVSFHSYYPKDYLTTRDKIYHLKNNEVWLHDPRDCDGKYGNFFGEQFDTIIDIKHVFPQAGQYNSHFIATDAEIISDTYTLYSRDLTFDRIAFWNDRQSGGLHKLDVQKNTDKQVTLQLKDNYSIIPAFKSRSYFKVNELYDFTENSEGALIQYKNRCNFMYEPVNYNINNALINQDYKQRRLSGNWFITRLIWDNLNDSTKLYMKFLTLNVTFKNE